MKKEELNKLFETLTKKREEIQKEYAEKDKALNIWFNVELEKLRD